ncbi:hypothetical protein LPJ64_000053 [Coemansia asiatica]|uniref:Uncharacterized protein n=1 Tax=Coemansia asiatica TaxID=1052880 RepID=A0A9W8CMS9_9FUNG|nr:hypothetical protein LPJ64_000053 [Coemansia asiatica]
MKLLSIIVSLYLSANAVIGAPLIKAIISTLGVEQPIATGVYGIASVGASFAVEHTGLFGPLLNNLPGAQVILNAANLLGGRFAGATAGGIASKATLGFLEGELGNNIPIIGGIIRDEQQVSQE